MRLSLSQQPQSENLEVPVQYQSGTRQVQASTETIVHHTIEVEP